MPNTFMTTKQATNALAKIAAGKFVEDSQIIKVIDKEPASSFKSGTYGNGSTISVVRPARFVMNTGSDVTSQIQDIIEEKANLDLVQRNVAVGTTSFEIATDVDLATFGKTVLEPQVTALVAGIETEMLAAISNATANFVGTQGTIPAATSNFLQAKRFIREQSAPMDDGYYAVLSENTNAAVADYRKGGFNAPKELSEIYRTGLVGVADGMTYLTSNLLPTFTTGTQAGFAGALSNGASQTGSTIAIDTMTGSATIRRGTVITFAGVFEVNPITKASYNYLKRFVVTADATLSSGAGNLSISPAIVATGPNRNVSNAIADNSAITFLSGTTASTGQTQNLVMHKSAVRFASVPLHESSDTESVSVANKGGISIRVEVFKDGYKDTRICRVDALVGWSIVRPEWICRVTE